MQVIGLKSKLLENSLKFYFQQRVVQNEAFPARERFQYVYFALFIPYLYSSLWNSDSQYINWNNSSSNSIGKKQSISVNHMYSSEFAAPALAGVTASDTPQQYICRNVVENKNSTSDSINVGGEGSTATTATNQNIYGGGTSSPSSLRSKDWDN